MTSEITFGSNFITGPLILLHQKSLLDSQLLFRSNIGYNYGRNLFFLREIFSSSKSMNFILDPFYCLLIVYLFYQAFPLVYLKLASKPRSISQLLVKILELCHFVLQRLCLNFSSFLVSRH